MAVAVVFTLFLSCLSVSDTAFGYGAFAPLPSQELAPICRESGQRIVVVYAHPPGVETTTPTEEIRKDVKRMNWKISDQSSISSKGARAVKMAVDCSGGAIQVYNIEVTGYTVEAIKKALDKELFGYPEEKVSGPVGEQVTIPIGTPVGTDAVKYLIYAPKRPEGFPSSGRNEGGTYGQGYGVGYEDASKSRNNKVARTTRFAMITKELAAGWETHLPMHELFHTLGAVYGGFKSVCCLSPNAPPPPYSTYRNHCLDGIDLMCYPDGGEHSPWWDYTETRCSGEKGYGTGLTMPIDCGYDTYFNAAPESGTWLAEYWNLAGSENPFFAVMPSKAPKVQTEAPTGVDSNGATLRASVTPNADYAFYGFEYGPTTAYGTVVPQATSSSASNALTGVPGYGNSPVAVSFELNGLPSHTTYHYRVVAKNDAGEIVYGADQAFATNDAPVAYTDPAAVDPSKPSAILKGRVDTHGLATTYQFEYGETKAYGSKVAIPAKDVTTGQLSEGLWAVEEELKGLKYGTIYHARLVATNADGTGDPGEDITFETTSETPLVTTDPASSISAVEATLNGTIDTKEAEGFYGFTYSTTPIDPSNYPGWTTVRHFDEGSGILPVSETIGDLQPETTYHFLVSVVTVTGGEWILENFEWRDGIVGKWHNAEGKELTFTTLEERAVTSPATNLGSSKATLHGTVKPKGVSTSFQFEYGATTAYGSKAPALPQGVGSGSSPVEVNQALEGLKAATTYHYRIVATNSAKETFYGGDKTFTTWGAWSTQSTPNVTQPVAESKLEAVSCASSTLCLGVGNDLYTGKAFAQAWNGSEWKPAVSGIKGTLYGIKCNSTTSCVAVGKTSTGAPLAQRLDLLFGSWVASAQTTPAPSGGTEVELRDVSCTASNACTAVGSYLKEGTRKTLAERWNGTEWSIQTTTNPESGSAELLGVSCDAAGSCTAVGTQGSKTFAERWNGTSWSTSTTPNQSGAESTVLEKVSCTSGSFCLAVGSYKEGFNRWAYTARWNGSEWTAQAAAKPEGAKATALLGVSCSSSTACIAVGRSVIASSSGDFGVTEQKTLAESWGGSEWQVQTSTNPEGKKLPRLTGVSCTASNACTAVGWAQKGSGEAETTTVGERYE